MYKQAHSLIYVITKFLMYCKIYKVCIFQCINIYYTNINFKVCNKIDSEICMNDVCENKRQFFLPDFLICSFFSFFLFGC